MFNLFRRKPKVVQRFEVTIRFPDGEWCRHSGPDVDMVAAVQRAIADTVIKPGETYMVTARFVGEKKTGQSTRI